MSGRGKAKGMILSCPPLLTFDFESLLHFARFALEAFMMQLALTFP